jgi:hypothetical protein
MTFKHTPGPWAWWTSNSFRRLSSQATRRDGDVLHGTVQSDGHADVVLPNGGAEGPDALLLAAAPDLLEALNDLSAVYTHAWDLVDGGLMMFGDSIPRFEAAHAKARAAIGKATGEACAAF